MPESSRTDEFSLSALMGEAGFLHGDRPFFCGLFFTELFRLRLAFWRSGLAYARLDLLVGEPFYLASRAMEL